MNPYTPPQRHDDEPSLAQMVVDDPSRIESVLETERFFILAVATVLMVWTLLDWWW